MYKNFIHEFTPGTLSEGNAYFKASKFNAPNQKDFRYAVREAMRISTVNGQKFSDDQIAMVRAFDNWKKEESWELPLSSCCSKCKGGESSGPILYCEGCNVAPNSSQEGDVGSGVAIHFHCLQTPQNYRDCAWYCDKCCFSKGMKPGTIIETKKKDGRFKDSKDDKEESGAGGSTSSSSPSNRKRKEQDRSGNAGGETKEKKVDKRRKERSDTDISDNSFPFPNTDGEEKGPAGGGRKAKGSRGYVPVIAPGAIGSVNLYGQSSSHNSRCGRYAAGSDSDSEEEDNEDTMDYCFVCGDGGTLVLCDFPQCPRAYHQACIAPTFPQSLDEAPSSACDALDDPWFCPCHTCNTCGVLQATPNLDTKFLMLPKHLYTKMMEEKQQSLSGTNSTSGPKSNGMHSLSALRQDKLTLCEGCPFSLCQACEHGENVAASTASSSSSAKAGIASAGSEAKKADEKSPPQSSFFNYAGSVLVPAHVPTSSAYRGSHQGKYHCYCSHCSQPRTLTKLARVLEMAWSRMCQSRSALPFLMPFLQPGEPTGEEQSDDAASKEEPTSLAEACNFFPKCGAYLPCQETSFVQILNNIRALKYTSSAQFVADIKSVKDFVQQASECWAKVPEEKRVVPVNTDNASEKALQGSKGTVGKMFDSGFLKKNHEFAPHPLAKYFPSAEETQFLTSSFDTALRLCESVLMEKKWLLTRFEGDLAANKGQAGARASDAMLVDAMSGQIRTDEESPASPMKKAKISETMSVSTSKYPFKEEASSSSSTKSAGQDTLVGTSGQVWRSECEKDLPYRETAFPRKRTMTQWVTYLQGGSRRAVNKYAGVTEIDTLNQSVSHVIRSVVNDEGLGSAIYGYGLGRGRGGSIDGININNGVIDTAGFNVGVNSQAFGNVYQDYDFRQFDAEKALYNLKGSSRAEDVTLLEAGGKGAVLEDWSDVQDRYDKSNAGSSKASVKSKHNAADAAASSGNVFTPHAKRALKLYSDGNLDEYLATDETLVMLDRLKEMTRKTLHLEARLRREYLATKQFVRETSIEKVNIGDMSLIREMKLANDDLRWRMSQKNRALAASEAMVQHLQAQLQADGSTSKAPIPPPPQPPQPKKK